MDRKHTPPADPERAEEARHVAEDAIEAAQDGNPEEARFLAGEARSLDADAANAALAGTELAKGDEAMSSGTTTTDHETIRKWAESRGGRPSVVKATEGADHEGILRFDFREKDESLDEVDWDDFFRTFEDRKLALLYQDKTADGHTSRFFKFVRREH